VKQSFSLFLKGLKKGGRECSTPLKRERRNHTSGDRQLFHVLG
jgi:hypothetical protein